MSNSSDIYPQNLQEVEHYIVRDRKEVIIGAFVTK